MAKKARARSRYDDLHDKYHKILTTKAGTRYERLAATVFKVLEDSNVVIHDIKLTGDDPEVKHQIDVTVDAAGKPRRVVIECKDFDISQDKVGIDVVRNFRSVVEDTGVDEGIVLTCTGFTEEARKYARSKGIKLAILRLFEPRDMEGRIAKVIINFIVRTPKNTTANVWISEADRSCYLAQLASIGAQGGVRSIDPVYFVRCNERHQLNAFLQTRSNDALTQTGQSATEITILPEGWKIQVADNPPLSFDRIVVGFNIDELRFPIHVMSQHVAELILSGFGKSDLIVFGSQIQRFTIDPATGEVKAVT